MKMREVTLGMPGPWAVDNYEVSDHYTTKIGGLPDWPVLNAAINHDFLKCNECGSNLCLVAQIYAPFSSKTAIIEERVLYVFGCMMDRCGSTLNSWRVLRVQKFLNGEESKSDFQDTVPMPEASGSSTNWQDDLWTIDGEDDGNSDDIDLEELGRALSEAGSLASYSKKNNSNFHSESPQKPASIKATRVVHRNMHVLPCFYIYNQKEVYSKEVSCMLSSYSSLSIKEDQSNHDDHAEDEKWEEESYEYDKALNVDRTYLKFKKRLDAYPEQCFRYSFGGKPLLATGEAGEPGTCSLCGGSRDYEVQLMPPLLYFLQEGTNDHQRHSLDNWNWQTLIVYTCSKSCSTSSDQEASQIPGWIVAEEKVLVQYE